LLVFKFRSSGGDRSYRVGLRGLVIAACFAEIGHEVICVDQDEKRIAALQAGEVPIHEEFFPELVDPCL
jgi:UDPglucose 6-dehydrogenase